jgi:anaerobic magnesium-protoporphyrin IX monomethyl ester cyclase
MRPDARRLWVDLGDLGAFVRPAGAFERWQDHGLGLLRTILHREGLMTDVASVRAIDRWDALDPLVRGYDVLLMNVRSYTFPLAVEVAARFKQQSPGGLVLVGGMHATVAPEEMEAVPHFDRIVRGPGEGSIVPLVTDPGAFPRLVEGVGARSMDEWPQIDRTLWPTAPSLDGYPWPLEPDCGWGPGPVATVMTSRVCPWQCAFCNEASYISPMGRRSPDAVVDELNALDEAFGPLGSVVIHDSMFFQQPAWLERWLVAYTTRARRRWPYWAAARSVTIRRWPDLFERLVRDTHWRMVSVGFESGSDRMLRVLNKECTAEDNYFAIDLLNAIGDDLTQRGEEPPRFWANIMLGIPGETPSDAFDTMRMVHEMRYCQISPAFYAPYPGSALGYQIIAEGGSRLTKDNYHRYPHDEKVHGIDYPFYKALLDGQYAATIAGRPRPGRHSAPGHPTGGSRFFLFDRPGQGAALAYGRTPEDALETHRTRRGDTADDGLSPDRVRVITQRELQQVRHTLR